MYEGDVTCCGGCYCVEEACWCNEDCWPKAVWEEIPAPVVEVPQWAAAAALVRAVRGPGVGDEV